MVIKLLWLHLLANNTHRSFNSGKATRLLIIIYYFFLHTNQKILKLHKGFEINTD